MVININNVTKSYRSDFLRKKHKAVADVSLDIRSGEILGIIGANGAGKSTMIKMILGFVKPDKGEIRINGRHPFDPESRIKMGYLPENPYFYTNLTVTELLQFSASASGVGRKIAGPRIKNLLQTVDLYPFKDQKLKTFSKGMTQRAGICFALVHDPQIIVLDEPMSGLDPLGRKMVIDLILDLQNKGKTILFCSHILNDVERICDRVAVMDKGRLKNIFDKKQIGEQTMENIFLAAIKETASC